MDQVLILLSGGLDSTACVEFFRSNDFAVRTLFVNYGQAAAKPQYYAAQLVSKHYKVPLTTLSLSGGAEQKIGLINGRNALLVFCALLEFRATHGIVGLGIHQGTPYFDCSSEFLNQLQPLV